MAVLGNADVLAAIAATPSIATDEVECPELGGSVLVREMSGTVRNRLEAAFAAISEGNDGGAMDKVMTALISACVVDASGRPFITGDMAGRLVKNHPRAAFRIRDAVVKLSGTSEDDVKELEESFG
ncbi:hypothetical protein BKA00_007431 [Actinomadura coerulea]|uniref:Uncharacterized protein n=1 Tax=Actinomadura coerulea TaxID=46159 RepID=A0A7X0L3F4_9ACTN|nr:hypothetical protein [Actinomadura coerulea]MBB6400517.1 hypothetical protein [Actinomadura coerulea]GGQ07790.1 hypothetical protein GCM10010187_24840 [Actinomadura coerulea]